MHTMDAILISAQGSGYKGVSETEEVSDTFFLCDRNSLSYKTLREDALESPSFTQRPGVELVRQ